MDFEIRYTKEQEAFRQEVRTWLEANSKVPPGLGEIPLEHEDVSREMWQWGRQFMRKLGARGWLFPLWPKEYDGGGLSPDYDIILKEELARIKVPQVYNNTLASSSIMVYGAEEQKRHLLAPMLRGETVTWQLFTEPEAGSDLASLKTRAIKDGDDFIITGEKIFIGGSHPVDYFWCLAMTDPDAPRHQNIGAFYFPANLSGVTIHPMNLIVKGGKRHISLDGVRVSRQYLIGGENDGWRVAQTTLEVEHGAAGFIEERDPIIPDFIKYCRETLRNGQPLSREPIIQQTVVDVYIDSCTRRLIGLRNYWMFNTKQPMSYHGSQNSLLGKHLGLRTGEAILNTLGLHALTSDRTLGPLEGSLELHQRTSLTSAHPGGSIEIQKLIMARRIGISRTRERAAPTHAG